MAESPGVVSPGEGQGVAATVQRKTYKWYGHGHTFSTESLIVRSDDFPDVVAGDILEIYHEEDNFSRLLLQVRIYHPKIVRIFDFAGET